MSPPIWLKSGPIGLWYSLEAEPSGSSRAVSSVSAVWQRVVRQREQTPESKAVGRTEKIAAALVVVSCLLYAGIFAVPFLAEETTSRIGISGGLALAGEGTFWLGVLVAGPAVMRRYRSKLSPRNWRRQEVLEQPDSNRAA